MIQKNAHIAKNASDAGQTMMEGCGVLGARRIVMSKCEYENDRGHCMLNECMYGDFLDRDDSAFMSGYPICFKPKDVEDSNDNKRDRKKAE